MSLWTPDGEHVVPDNDEPTYSDVPPGSMEDLDPETAEQLQEELARSQAQLLAAPVEQVVSNHVMGLFELGALHLRVGNLDAARLPIDAMGVMVDNLGDRLAEAETLTAALTQLRMAYVELANSANDETDETDETDSDGDATDPSTEADTDEANADG
ncbi:MAG: hypothetical protein GXP35_09885 [Actinobacteria bacterium]|nr:hypothetical protein [Actinomycetota bacterium]